VSNKYPVTSVLLRHAYQVKNGTEIRYRARDFEGIYETEVNVTLSYVTDTRDNGGGLLTRIINE
jgi:hypothetical protein